MTSPRRMRVAATTLVFTGCLLATLTANAQFLLKEGQGLAGAPEAVPEVTEQDGNTAPLQKLPEVKVEGELDPLTEGDRKRRAQIKALPGLGTEEERNLNRLEKLREWYDALPKDANALTADQKAFLEEQKEFDAKPVARPGVPTSSERLNPADYRDPIKAVTP